MKQALVFGVGIFGMSLARELSARGVEVICLDKNPDRIQVASDFASEALVLDATERDEIGDLHPEMRDLCVCAIGEDSRDSSIVCTALLSELGARRIVARAYDPLHARILHMVGAHEVVDPERAFGRRLAARLSFRGVLDQVSLGSQLEITEVAVPRAFVGRSLRELQLPKHHEVYVVALRGGPSEQDDLRLPTPDTRLESNDVLVLTARQGSVQKMLEGLR
jgi:trk system potassium uptake protein TrkA